MKKIPPKIAFPNKPAEDMVIGAYVEPLLFGKYVKWGLDVTEDEAYDDLKASGCNTIFQTESKLHEYGKQLNMNMFRKTSERGLTFLQRDGLLINNDNRPVIRTYEEAKEYFKYYEELEKFSSFAGIHYVDEPGYKDWKAFAAVQKAFKEKYPDKFFYINLLQVYAPAWALSNGPVYKPDSPEWINWDPDYIKYYETCMEEVKPEVFSYDHYPLRDAFPYVEDDYFLQLHLSYKYAEQANVPLFAFIQAGSWGDRTRVPNEAELRWQINCAIAYNTKHLAYFTYWVPTEHHRGMFIDTHGNRTRIYFICQKINKELLFQDEYFLNAGFSGYMQFGDMPGREMPVEEDRIKTFASFKEVTGGNLFIGCFEYLRDGKYYNMYYVVNNDLVNEVHETFRFTKNLDYTLVYRDSKTVSSGSEIALDLTPGDACIIIEELA